MSRLTGVCLFSVELPEFPQGIGRIRHLAIELFDAFSLRGFLGHEMAHLVSDSVAQGCNDYILRDPQMEVQADALAVRTLGTGPVKAFLQRVLALTQGQNWDARHRLEALQ